MLGRYAFPTGVKGRPGWGAYGRGSWGGVKVLSGQEASRVVWEGVSSNERASRQCNFTKRPVLQLLAARGRSLFDYLVRLGCRRMRLESFLASTGAETRLSVVSSREHSVRSSKHALCFHIHFLTRLISPSPPRKSEQAGEGGEARRDTGWAVWPSPSWVSRVRRGGGTKKKKKEVARGPVGHDPNESCCPRPSPPPSSLLETNQTRQTGPTMHGRGGLART